MSVIHSEYSSDPLICLVLREGFSLRESSQELELTGPYGTAKAPYDPQLSNALSLLRTGRPYTFEMLRISLDSSNHVRENALRSIIEWLCQNCAIYRGVFCGQRRLITCEPYGEYYKLPISVLVSDIDTFELSPFAWLRTHEGACVLETALLPVRAVLNDPEIAAIICYFAKPKSLELVAVGRQECNKRILEAVVQLLVEEGFILRFNSGKSVNGELQDVNPQPIALSQWDFHDLLFHSRSRIGRTNARFGATFRFKNSENKPLPAVKRTMSVNRIQLFVPNLEALLRCDFPGTYILEARRSQRCNSARPITALELGEFLFRSARVRSVYEIDGMELSNRPYPCGGASYELEIYPLIRRCQGLPSGVYHYDPLSHVLESISEPNSDSDRLISDASISSGSLVIPDVLLVVTARFRRVSYKYESIAYATILKDVGCLYQTMYLVATSMQLASCALGSGDSDRFSKILNINYCEESSVGEFMLGDMR